jgi:hypothetical protein
MDGVIQKVAKRGKEKGAFFEEGCPNQNQPTTIATPRNIINRHTPPRQSTLLHTN